MNEQSKPLSSGRPLYLNHLQEGMTKIKVFLPTGWTDEQSFLQVDCPTQVIPKRELQKIKSSYIQVGWMTKVVYMSTIQYQVISKFFLIYVTFYMVFYYIWVGLIFLDN